MFVCLRNCVFLLYVMLGKYHGIARNGRNIDIMGYHL